MRQCIRREMKMSESFVVGHVGRFMAQKNHSRLLDIFSDIRRLNPNSKLLLVGEGELMESVRKKVNDLDLETDVIFCRMSIRYEYVVPSYGCTRYAFTF